MRVVLVFDVERADDEIIERDKGRVMVILRNLLLDEFDPEGEYVVTSVPEFYT